MLLGEGPGAGAAPAPVGLLDGEPAAPPRGAAAVGALSRFKAGRCVFLSQIVGDAVLRVAPPDAAHGAALALEAVVRGRRWRLELAREDVASVIKRTDGDPELSRRAESKLECLGCGRRFGTPAHFQAHQSAPCALAARKKPPAKGDEPAKKKRKPAAVVPPATTARIVLAEHATATWKYETLARLDAAPGGDSFDGGGAAWADDAEDRDPLRGEVARVGVLTLRPRAGFDLDALLGHLLDAPGADADADPDADGDAPGDGE